MWLSFEMLVRTCDAVSERNFKSVIHYAADATPDHRATLLIEGRPTGDCCLWTAATSDDGGRWRATINRPVLSCAS
jgi:hypothetical protein